MALWSDTAKSELHDHVSQFRLGLAAAQNPDPVEKPWWSVLITLSGISIDQFEKAAAEHADDLLIPVAYTREDRAITPQHQPVAIFARQCLIEKMNDPENDLNVTGLHLGAITPPDQLDFHANPPDLSEISVAPDAVVMAVIDDGIAIAHDLFRKDPFTTRVEHASILQASSVQGGRASVGRVLEKREINRHLRECTHNGLLDEDAFYQQTGIVDRAADTVSTVAMRASHGTFVTSVAAGQLMEECCKNRPIICVALPQRVVEDTTGLDSLPILYLSLHILSQQARRFRCTDGSLAPVVFNFSFGNSGGPHDGKGLFAKLFEHYFGKGCDSGKEPQKSWLMLPAGNANLRRLHGVAKDPATHFDLTLLPDDHTPSVVQIWQPPGNGDSAPAEVRVKTPSGQSASISFSEGRTATLKNDREQEIARLACEGGTNDRLLITLSVAPTASMKSDAPLAPAGDWKIRVKGRDKGAINLWIRRDETLPGTLSGGRQAWFSNPDYERFDRFGAPLPVDPPDTDSPIRRAGTLSGFAWGESPVVVAAYSEREEELSLYSAAGFEGDKMPPGQRIGPDLTGKGDDSHALPGVIAAGSRSGSWVRLSGTSVAAPRVARAAAAEIRDSSESAREWGASAANFTLPGDPPPARAGAGGIRIPLPWNADG